MQENEKLIKLPVEKSEIFQGKDFSNHKSEKNSDINGNPSIHNDLDLGIIFVLNNQIFFLE
jgi:hypothetical protein